MLDVQNPEIRVEEIMQRIHDKVRARREAQAAVAGAPPPLASDPGWQRIDEVFARAQDVAQVGATLPAMTRTRGLKRVIAGGMARAFLRVAQLITRDQRAFNLATLDILRALHDRLRGDVNGLRSDLSALRSELASLRADVQTRMGDLQAAEARKHGEIGTELAQLRTKTSLQERRLDSLLEEARKRLAAPLDSEQLEAMAAEAPHLLDATYLHFEDGFRGSREDIKQRVAEYLPKLRAAGAGTPDRPILDLGCGRGELLEVLRADGLAGSGVDMNRAAVEQCQERGLPVELGDAFEMLRKVPDESLGGVTALHVVEHLPFALLIKLLDETLRVLRPGGIAIFETPNPKNVLVGSANFYIDPTHKNPVHPETLKYLMEARGLTRTETLMLHPCPPQMRLPEADSELARRFNEYFYGPQDYAVVGYRA